MFINELARISKYCVVLPPILFVLAIGVSHSIFRLKTVCSLCSSLVIESFRVSSLCVEWLYSNIEYIQLNDSLSIYREKVERFVIIVTFRRAIGWEIILVLANGAFHILVGEY